MGGRQFPQAVWFSPLVTALSNHLSVGDLLLGSPTVDHVTRAFVVLVPTIFPSVWEWVLMGFVLLLWVRQNLHHFRCHLPQPPVLTCPLSRCRVDLDIVNVVVLKQRLFSCVSPSPVVDPGSGLILYLLM